MSMAAAIRAPAIADPIPTPAAAPGLIEFELFRVVVLVDDPMGGFDVEMLVRPEEGLGGVIDLFVELVDGVAELRLGDVSDPGADGLADEGEAPNPTPDGNATTS